MLRKIKNNMTRTQMIALGYFLLIALGTLLLMLPAASKTGEKTNVLTALFTATSATCVTGLVVVDTGTYWSVFGQCVILGLIQIGGLGFVTIGVLFATVLNRKITLRTRGLLQESMNVSQMGGVVRLAKLALRGTAVIELTGAFLLSLRFVPEFGVIKGIGFGIFHSISAFCNAGFDLMGADKGVYSSFTSYAGDALVNLVIMILIGMG